MDMLCMFTMVQGVHEQFILCQAVNPQGACTVGVRRARCMRGEGPMGPHHCGGTWRLLTPSSLKALSVFEWGCVG
jgi:hypothetical protein